MGVSERAGAELSIEYHNFSVAEEVSEIFELKDGPVPKNNGLKCDIWNLSFTLKDHITP